MTAHTNGMVSPFISTATNSIAMEVIAPIVVEAEIQRVLVVSVKIVRLKPKRIALRLVVHILAIIRHVAETHVVAATAKQAGRKIVKGSVSQTMSTNHG